MDIKVETIYRVRIEYWFDQDWTNGKELSKSERVNEYVLEHVRNKSNFLDINYYNPSPASNAYIVIEGLEKELIVKAAKQTCNYIKKFKGNHIWI